MKRLLPILLLFILSCDDDDVDPLVDPLAAKLTGTSWQLEKSELLEANGNVYLTVESTDDPLKGAYIITFYDTETILAYYEKTNSSCGQWAVENGKLKFALISGQIIPDFCDPSNFSIHQYSPGADIEVVDEQMTLDVWGFNEKPKVMDMEEIQDKLNSGELKMRSYYKRSGSPTFQPDLSCCAKFDWF